MTTQVQHDFLVKAYDAAVAAHHPFPEIAACEAALESGWGQSELALKANNLFGRKVWKPGQNVLQLPTKEYEHGQWEQVLADWEMFPTWADCFADRVRILTTDPRYKIAMEQTTPGSWITAVSRVWSTDPDRATKVLETYQAHVEVFSQRMA